MKDVASAAGVALKTVSRVVNGEPGVNPATADRVRSAIESLGYSRNESARVLRRGRTATVGLVIEDIADPFYSGSAGPSSTSRSGTGACCSAVPPVRTRCASASWCARSARAGSTG